MKHVTHALNILGNWYLLRMTVKTLWFTPPTFMSEDRKIGLYITAAIFIIIEGTAFLAYSIILFI